MIALGCAAAILSTAPSAEGRSSKGEAFVRVQAPHLVRYGVPRVAVRTEGRPTFFVVRLNGRNISERFLRPNGMPRTATLSPSEGLHRGRNRLKVKSGDEDVRDTDRATIVVRSRRLPAAGPDRQIWPGDALRLSGSRSLPAHNPDHRALTYRWRIRRAPKGSKARLRGRKTARPRLITDRRGVYRIELALREPRRGRRSAAGSRAGSGLVSMRDRLDVQATITPPIGLPVSTLDQQGGVYGITVEGTFYPNPDSTNNSVQILVFNKSTMAFESNTPYAVESGPSLGSDIAAMCDPGGNEAVLAAVPPPIADAFAEQVQGTETPNCLDLQNESDYSNGISLVGVGDTTQNWRGPMIGYLQQNEVIAPTSSTTVPTPSVWYRYVPGDYVLYDTNLANPPPNGNTIQIGGPGELVDVTDTQQLPAGASGFHALAIDAQSLQVADSEAFATTDGPNDQQGITDLSSWLQQYEGDPNTRIILQSLGAPSASANPDPGDWSQAATAISQIGGNSHIFNTVNGSYALFGGADMGPDEPSDGAELSSSATGSPAQLRGVISRDGLYNFAPRLTDPGENLDVRMMAIAYQHPVAWGIPDDTAGQQNAGQFLVERLLAADVPVDGNTIDDLRQGYWHSSTFARNASSYVADLNCDQNPGGTTGVDFSGPDFGAVCLEFTQEFNQVTTVSSLLGVTGDTSWGDLQQSLIASSMYQISNDIENTIVTQLANYDPGDTGLPAEILGFVSDIAWVGEEAFPEDGLSTIGLFASLSGLTSDAASTVSGGAADDPLQDEADQLVNDFLDNTATTVMQFDQLQGIIVSDPDKLAEVAALAGTSASGQPGPWTFGTAAQATAQDAFTHATVRWAYRELLPAQYNASVLVPSNSNPPNTAPDNYLCLNTNNQFVHAFGSPPPQSYFDHYDTPTTQDAYWILLQGNQFQPSASLAAALQAPGINLYLPWLFEELELRNYNGLSGNNSCTP